MSLFKLSVLILTWIIAPNLPFKGRAVLWGISVGIQIPAAWADSAADWEAPLKDDIAITPITPDRRGGRAYELVYRVQVPLASYWRFKTDFDNDFLVSHKYIRAHRFLGRTGNVAITEDKYTHGPDVFFRWETTVLPRDHRLEFRLLNPYDCRQKFHYGYIQAKAVAGGTQVTQVAYFDFWGVSLWAVYPWGGGMNDFLTATARWEQATAVRLKARNRDPSGVESRNEK